MSEKTTLMTYSCQVSKQRVQMLQKKLFGLTTFSLSELNLTQKEREKEILRVSSQLGLTVFPLIESS
jgi:urease accessory protein UreE